LPRLFVYHCEAERGSKQSETFKVMERRLLKAIINPAMIATWGLGLWLAWAGGVERAGWLAGTVVRGVGLSALPGQFARVGRAVGPARPVGARGARLRRRSKPAPG